MAKYQLPQHALPGTEIGRAGHEVIRPHALETLAIVFLKLGPGQLNVGMPSHEGFVVIGPEVMPVFKHQPAINMLGDFTGRWDFSIRKNVFVDPRIGGFGFFKSANRVQ